MPAREMWIEGDRILEKIKALGGKMDKNTEDLVKSLENEILLLRVRLTNLESYVKKISVGGDG